MNYNSKITEFEGIHSECPVLCLESNFKGLVANLKVTSVLEHMYKIDFENSPEEEKEPRDPHSFFEEKTAKVPLNEKVLENIKKCSRRADALIIFTDQGAEGENICVEIMENVDQEFPQPLTDYVFRAKFLSLSSQEILKSFEKLDSRPVEHLSLSYDALKTIDLKISRAFSSQLSQGLFEAYPLLESISKPFVYDTLQAAALSMVVERAERIEKFVPEPFFNIDILIKQSRTGFKTYELQWKREKLYDEQATKAIMEDIKRERIATVVELDSKEKTIPPPLGLSTNKMLKIASSKLNLSPVEALKILKNLYLHGYITYFLTESTNYGKDFDFEEILSTHQLHSIWGQYALNLLEKGYIKPFTGKQIDGNLPLVPIKSAEKVKMSQNEWKMYQYICKNFLASVSKPAVYAVNSATFSIKEELFILSSEELLEASF